MGIGQASGSQFFNADDFMCRGLSSLSVWFPTGGRSVLCDRFEFSTRAIVDSRSRCSDNIYVQNARFLSSTSNLHTLRLSNSNVAIANSSSMLRLQPGILPLMEQPILARPGRLS